MKCTLQIHTCSYFSKHKLFLLLPLSNSYATGPTLCTNTYQYITFEVHSHISDSIKIFYFYVEFRQLRYLSFRFVKTLCVHSPTIPTKTFTMLFLRDDGDDHTLHGECSCTKNFSVFTSLACSQSTKSIRGISKKQRILQYKSQVHSNYNDIDVYLYNCYS